MLLSSTNKELYFSISIKVVISSLYSIFVTNCIVSIFISNCNNCVIDGSWHGHSDSEICRNCGPLNYSALVDVVNKFISSLQYQLDLRNLEHVSIPSQLRLYNWHDFEPMVSIDIFNKFISVVAISARFTEPGTCFHTVSTSFIQLTRFWTHGFQSLYFA